MTREYAVLDVETTGKYPKNDRVIEIAILRLDGCGNKTSEYTTLINPQRDLGPTHIHNITGVQVANAPLFHEVAGDVTEMLRGATMVAHNAVFDRGILFSEFSRIGIKMPDIPVLCTLNLSTKLDDSVPSRKLTLLCHHFGVPLLNAHSAYADAEATAALLRKFSERLGGWERLEDYISGDGEEIKYRSWPFIEPSGCCYTRSDAMLDVEREQAFLSRMVMKLPPSSEGNNNVNEYMALLDEVLEDRRLEEGEIWALHGLALHLGLCSNEVASVHEKYITNVIRAALADKIITESEMKDLVDVQHLLGIPDEQFHSLLEDGKKAVQDLSEKSSDNISVVLKGKTVCFTGAFQCNVNGSVPNREMVKLLAEEAGLIVKSSISKRLDYLVLADPHSMSGKAKKAREYGVRILAESVFWNYMGLG
jgi:DNA polymerase III epsilon subunit family exonuclease